MSATSCRRSLCLACLAALVSPSWADDAIQLAPREGVLVLAHGGELQGQISRSGDKYHVALEHGELRIHHDEVEMVCRSLDEVYQRKRAEIAAGHVRQHVELGNWCLSHDLIGYAANELAAALQANPHHPDIPPLRRRVASAIAPPPDAPRPSAVSHAPVSRVQFEKTIRQLPPAALETFKQTVQPVLLNHCATSGCHNPRSKSNFTLLRIPPGRTASLKLTHRNLNKVLQSINRDDAAKSELLTAATMRHGGLSSPVFADNGHPHYRQLQSWVAMISRPTPVDSEPVTVDRASLALLEKIDPPNSSPPTKPINVRPPGSGFVPIDPFDPEIFNRRFFPRERGD